MAHIRLENVSVELPIFDNARLRLIKLPSFVHARVGTKSVSKNSGAMVIHALTGINLELNDGDRVCLIGHNGAGKTTLLRLIAGIYPPSQGSVRVGGRVVALLGGSISLNSDATGYENIKLVAELYGWPRDQVADCIKDIENFTELGEYLSLPVRVYSAGMAARLAYGMATQLSPDVLLIDESIGAGDANFQEKAEARTKEYLDRSKIVLLASHATELCRAICNRALLLSGGRQVFFGEIEEGLDRYAKSR